MTERRPHPVYRPESGAQRGQSTQRTAGGSGRVLAADWVRRDPGACGGKGLTWGQGAGAALTRGMGGQQESGRRRRGEGRLRGGAGRQGEPAVD